MDSQQHTLASHGLESSLTVRLAVIAGIKFKVELVAFICTRRDILGCQVLASLLVYLPTAELVCKLIEERGVDVYGFAIVLARASNLWLLWFVIPLALLVVELLHALDQLCDCFAVVLDLGFGPASVVIRCKVITVTTVIFVLVGVSEG